MNAVEVEWARLPEIENKEDFLYASSRNNGIEYDLRAWAKAFQCQELSYFRDWDEIINRPPWTVALMCATLGNAIAGLNRFMSSLRDNPARCASILSGRSSEHEIAEAVRMPAPATFHEAYKRYEQHQRSCDGGDAERAWFAVAPDGTEHEVVLRIGLPTRAPGGEWRVAVTLGVLESRVHDIAGIDAWQAITLGMRFAATRVSHFADDGWFFYWERGGDPASPEELARAP